MINQRASISYSYSNPSIINYHKHLNRKRKIQVQTTSFDYLEVINLKEVNKEIIDLLKQYHFKRKFIVICSFIIILLISLNSSFLVIQAHDCNTFNLCSIDDDETKPLFFWIMIGINLTLLTILIFILLHLSHIKQFYTQTLNKLIKLEFNHPIKDEITINLHRKTNALRNDLMKLDKNNYNNNWNRSKVPSISIENFDDKILNSKRTDHISYDNPNFESDDQSKLSIELSELSFITSSSKSTSSKETSSHDLTP